MDTDPITPDVTPDSSTEMVTDQPVPTTTAGETPDTTQADDRKYVPYERFSEVNSTLKQTREELAEIKNSLSSIGQPAQPEVEALDPDVQKTLDAYIAQKGFVSKQELEGERMRAQAQQDLQTIKTSHNLSDDEMEQVRSFAVRTGVNNAEGLEASYRHLFFDRIVEDRVKARLAEGGSATTVAEKPGPGGAVAPQSDKPGPGTSVRDRIRAATRR